MAVWRKKDFQQSNLETKPWKTLIIEEYSFLVKGMFTDNSYEILVTDFALIWEESLSDLDVLQRSKSVNPLIEAPTSVILQQLSKRLLESPQTHCTYKCKCSEKEVIISVEGPLQGSSGPWYQWDFRLTKAPPLLLKSHLVNPVLVCSVEMLRRQNELIRIIKKKDKEISDYKEGGATISRKHLLTTPFNMESFENDMTKSQEFKEYSLNPVLHMGAQWQTLYCDIVSYKHWHSTEDTTEQVSPVHCSHPSSTVNLSPIKSPSKSPLKRSLEEPLSKDFEKSRREELEKKLEESKSKAKKKKKRLM